MSAGVFRARKATPKASEDIDSSVLRARKPDVKSFLDEEPEQPKSFTQRVNDQLQESEDLDREIERNQARSLSRMGERVFGLPGDVVEFIQSLTGRKAAENPFPTSASLQKKSEELSQGYTSPKTAFEEKADEFVGDVASMMLPGTGKFSVGRVLGIPLVGAMTEEGIRHVTDDESKAAIGKSGVMFALDLMSARRGMVPRKPGVKGAMEMGGPNKYVQSLFGKVQESIPQGAMADATGLEMRFNDLEKTLHMGGAGAPSTTHAMERINSIRARIQNGRIPVEELPAARVKINELQHQLGAFNFEVPKQIRMKSIENLNEVKRAIIESGENYGTMQNPKFGKLWKSANEAASVNGKANVVANFINKHVGNKLTSKGAQVVLGLGGATAGALAKPTLGILAGTITGALGTLYMAGKVAYRILNSPTLAGYYSKTLTAALKGQVGPMIQNAVLLDKKLKDEEDKQRKEIDRLLKK